MKSIANSDFCLLIDKLPGLIRLARKSMPPSDTRAANDARRLQALADKLSRAHCGSGANPKAKGDDDR